MSEAISIRGLSDGFLEKAEVKANAVGKNREAYLRDELERIISEPLVKERYAFRVYGKNGRGTLRRLGDHPNETGATFSNFSQEEADAIHRAEDYMRRSGPGDREEALYALKGTFEEVFEVPV
jgi:hypothetical protein